MSIFSLTALLFTLTAIFAHLNHQFIHLAPTVGLMGLSLLFSLALIGAGELGLPIQRWASSAVAGVNFSEALATAQQEHPKKQILRGGRKARGNKSNIASFSPH